MKGKLFTLSLLSLLTAQSYAVEIKSGKLLSSKEWTTPNTKGFVIKHDGKQAASIKNRLNMIKQALNTQHIKTSDQYTYVASMTGPLDVVANKVTDISGVGYYGVANYSQEPQMYLAATNVCVESAPGVSNCTFQTDEIQLDVGGAGYGVNEPVVQTTFAEPGNYTYTAIMGIAQFTEEGYYQFTDFAESVGTITVTDDSDAKKAHK